MSGKKDEKNELNREYEDFMTAPGLSVSNSVSKKILGHVYADLNPSVWRVSGKLALVHLLSAVFTLSACPQFGFRLLGEGMGLMHIFMRFGPMACTFACGSVFLGVSISSAMFFLRPEEIRKVRQHRLLHVASLAFLSLGFFIMMDADVFFSLGLIWLAGAILGGMGAFELGWKIRFSQGAAY